MGDVSMLVADSSARQSLSNFIGKAFPVLSPQVLPLLAFASCGAESHIEVALSHFKSFADRAELVAALAGALIRSRSVKSDFLNPCLGESLVDSIAKWCEEHNDLTWRHWAGLPDGLVSFVLEVLNEAATRSQRQTVLSQSQAVVLYALLSKAGREDGATFGMFESSDLDLSAKEVEERVKELQGARGVQVPDYPAPIDKLFQHCYCVGLATAMQNLECASLRALAERVQSTVGNLHSLSRISGACSNDLSSEIGIAKPVALKPESYSTQISISGKRPAKELSEAGDVVTTRGRGATSITLQTFAIQPGHSKKRRNNDKRKPSPPKVAADTRASSY